MPQTVFPPLPYIERLSSLYFIRRIGCRTPGCGRYFCCEGGRSASANGCVMVLGAAYAERAPSACERAECRLVFRPSAQLRAMTPSPSLETQLRPGKEDLGGNEKPLGPLFIVSGEPFGFPVKGGNENNRMNNDQIQPK